MPLEALRDAITPVGLHYLLIHYDIPYVDAASWRLTSTGSRAGSSRSTSTSCEGGPPPSSRRRWNAPATAGPGSSRAPISQPWVLEAVGTGRWRGTSLADLLTEAGLADGAREVLFTGLDRGIEKGEAQRSRGACRSTRRCDPRSSSPTT